MPSDSPKYIYKIADAAHWEKAQGKAIFPPMPIDVADGYLHCSTVSQLAKTLELYFAGQTNVAILAIETAQFETELKWEPSRGGALFPHLYVDLPMTAVCWHEFVNVNKEGHCDLPSTII